jgi:hypothetical protein
MYGRPPPATFGTRRLLCKEGWTILGHLTNAIESVLHSRSFTVNRLLCALTSEALLCCERTNLLAAKDTSFTLL